MEKDEKTVSYITPECKRIDVIVQEAQYGIKLAAPSDTSREHFDRLDIETQQNIISDAKQHHKPWSW